MKPTPAFVIKLKVARSRISAKCVSLATTTEEVKVFVNVCAASEVLKASLKKTAPLSTAKAHAHSGGCHSQSSKTGGGMLWEIPFVVGHLRLPHSAKLSGSLVIDVAFNGESLGMAQTNASLRNALMQTAMEATESRIGTKPTQAEMDAKRVLKRKKCIGGEPPLMSVNCSDIAKSKSESDDAMKSKPKTKPSKAKKSAKSKATLPTKGDSTAKKPPVESVGIELKTEDGIDIASKKSTAKLPTVKRKSKSSVTKKTPATIKSIGAIDDGIRAVATKRITGGSEDTEVLTESSSATWKHRVVESADSKWMYAYLTVPISCSLSQMSDLKATVMSKPSYRLSAKYGDVLVASVLLPFAPCLSALHPDFDLKATVNSTTRQLKFSIPIAAITDEKTAESESKWFALDSAKDKCAIVDITTSGDSQTAFDSGSATVVDQTESEQLADAVSAMDLTDECDIGSGIVEVAVSESLEEKMECSVLPLEKSIVATTGISDEVLDFRESMHKCVLKVSVGSIEPESLRIDYGSDGRCLKVSFIHVKEGERTQCERVFQLQNAVDAAKCTHDLNQVNLLVLLHKMTPRMWLQLESVAESREPEGIDDIIHELCNDTSLLQID